MATVVETHRLNTTALGTPRAQTFLALLDIAIDTIVRAGVDPRPKRRPNGEPILDNTQ